MLRSSYLRILILLVAAEIMACNESPNGKKTTQNIGDITNPDTTAKNDHPRDRFVLISHDVKVKAYFAFVDSLVLSLDSELHYPIDEYALILSNPAVIDTLIRFDYYNSMERGVFIYDQKEMTVLHRGDSLSVPTEEDVKKIHDAFSATVIDVNIPEYKLRILQNDSVLYTFDVRVGKYTSRFLKTAGRVVDLRTPIGTGQIVRIARDPLYMNPVDGHRYHTTRRDDGKYTALPQIPFLEPTIAGERKGALIHPTTNKSTLGQMHSNGCVGTTEAAAWTIYYHAPIGTNVVFRYDTLVVEPNGDTIHLKDIYHLKK